ncbi:pimeloyl-ACP methyl ester carboxylesterase [Spinactinospora alkalitolerans]|uniref:Pimeloyl-ACP methyl ester carboxylesterase n=1 Tax=Spinactinospora alkalitolerans TaxID=687207 RepID=A0A852TVL1_9ACTN|nr:alpha/beta hydrolase [Spinactinospora alkalitolerans]NYE47741.1 pimeloyl-ACP methyl ester carboxylesterase [Spinactinospora alkalitolerans]
MPLPALVVVHGAWHGPWCWRPLIERLPDVAVHPVALPSSGADPTALGGLYDDAEAVRAAVAGIEGPVVVCAHSYGGLPVTEALTGVGDVRRLVYLCSFQLDAGESLLGSVGGTPPEWWDVHEADGYVDALDPAAVFYGDVAPETARAAIGALGHQSLASVTQPLREAAWRTIPSTYVVCERDAGIPPFAQEAMAQRAQRVLRMDASHSPFLSRPAELAGLLRAELTEAAAR